MGRISSQKRKNYIINGDMRISQRGTSFVSPNDGNYTLDRYLYGKVGAMVHTLTQDTDVPTLAQAGYLFQNSLRMNLTTPDTSIAVGDYNLITQRIEGYNFTNLAQKQFTLSFWVKATLTGTYCVAFRNSGNDRSYIAEYTINTPSTWEYKTITVSASPSAGTWNYTNGIGLQVIWTIACGSTFQTTAGSWQTGNFFATSNQINGVNTGAADFRITGVMLNEGFNAQLFRPFGESVDQELVACQRYYEKSYNLDLPPGSLSTLGQIVFSKYTTSSSQPMWPVRFIVVKRNNPSVVIYDPVNGASNSYRDANGNPVSASANRIGVTGFQFLSASSTIQPGLNNENSLHYTADCEL